MDPKTMMIELDRLKIGSGAPLALIAGPCVIEDYAVTFEIARFLKNLCTRLAIPFIFKASFDKANRTALKSYRGPGLFEGLAVLERIKNALDVPIISDIHRLSEVEPAAKVLDIIQIPAFLCRQTDLIVAAAGTMKAVNIKKGQFLAPWDMLNVVEKAMSTGNRQIMLTERGTMFGYNNLVVDFRGIRIMQGSGCPVIFDATHSIQLPGGAGNRSGGQREYAPVLAAAAAAVGVDGIFMEVHSNPDRALCDGPNSLTLDTLPELLARLKAIRAAATTPAESLP